MGPPEPARLHTPLRDTTGKQFKQTQLQAALDDELFSTHVLPHYYTINWQKTFIRVYVDGGLLAEFNSSTSSSWASPSNPALMRLSLWSVAGMYSGPLAAGQVATSSFYDVRRVVCVKNSVANSVKSSSKVGRLRAGGCGCRGSWLALPKARRCSSSLASPPGSHARLGRGIAGSRPATVAARSSAGLSLRDLSMPQASSKAPKPAATKVSPSPSPVENRRVSMPPGKAAPAEGDYNPHLL